MTKVIIIGGGISGLTAAKLLQQKGIQATILEANNSIGGRVRSRVIDGYTIDRGFQVLLTAYPEAKAELDYDALNLKAFDPGALILKNNGKKVHIGDPIRKPSTLWTSFRADVGTLSDKLKMLQLRKYVLSKANDEIFEGEEMTTFAFLQKFGFSDKMIAEFFRPFFSGIFLEKDLVTSQRMFEFIFSMFSKGFASIPEKGMQAIPDQLAESLDKSNIKLNHRVEMISNNEVLCENGYSESFDYCIIATESFQSDKLLGHDSKPSSFVSTSHLHFEAEQLPYKKKLIALNSNPKSLVNNVCVLSQIASSYSESKHLISATIVGENQDKELHIQARKELSKWFPDSESWRLIDRQDIRYALPNQKSVRFSHINNIENGLIVIGDHQTNGSLNAAMKQGREAAEVIMKEL